MFGASDECFVGLDLASVKTISKQKHKIKFTKCWSELHRSLLLKSPFFFSNTAPVKPSCFSLFPWLSPDAICIFFHFKLFIVKGPWFPWFFWFTAHVCRSSWAWFQLMIPTVNWPFSILCYEFNMLNPWKHHGEFTVKSPSFASKNAAELPCASAFVLPELGPGSHVKVMGLWPLEHRGKVMEKNRVCDFVIIEITVWGKTNCGDDHWFRGTNTWKVGQNGHATHMLHLPIIICSMYSGVV